MFKDHIGSGIKFKKLLICHVDNYIGSLNPYTGEIKYEQFKKFTEFVTELMQNNPEYSFHNVTDSVIRDTIREKIQLDKEKYNRIHDESRY